MLDSKTALRGQSASEPASAGTHGLAQEQETVESAILEAVRSIRFGLYALYLGASHLGTRLGSLVAENVPRRDIAGRLRPVLKRYAGERRSNESFGDFCHRVGASA
jgi:sulfite reductase beta subunit-like hemoprotein